MTKKLDIEFVRENLRKTVSWAVTAYENEEISKKDVDAIIKAARGINVTIAKKEVDHWD